MSTIEFGLDASGFGILSSILAIGALIGALLAARREPARIGVIVIAAVGLGVGCSLAALAPNIWVFAATLTLCGITSMTVMNTSNAYIQTNTEPAMRGRVMAIFIALFAGGTPIGAPVVGLVSNQFGPRWALVIAAGSAIHRRRHRRHVDNSLAQPPPEVGVRRTVATEAAAGRNCGR